MRVALVAFAALAAAPWPALSEPALYRVAPGKEGPGIEVRLPYSVGTHEVRARAIAGEVRLDPEAPAALSGALSVSLADLISDNRERDCHMREGLGLDYTRSRFPKEHVCKDDELPKDGADAVAFPEIRFEARAADAPPLSELGAGTQVPVTVQGTWTLHGVSRPASLSLWLSRDASTPGALRLQGRVPIRLADFGIVIKSASVLFVTISVAEEATVLLDLRLLPARPR
jgi:polyisoprenoid-binding protein YceI